METISELGLALITKFNFMWYFYFLRQLIVSFLLALCIGFHFALIAFIDTLWSLRF